MPSGLSGSLELSKLLDSVTLVATECYRKGTHIKRSQNERPEAGTLGGFKLEASRSLPYGVRTCCLVHISRGLSDAN